MVEKEVSKRMRTYGLIGILLAILLVATIYSFGTTPGTLPLQPMPNVSPTPSASNNPSANPSVNPSIQPSPTQEPEISAMKTFSSYKELTDFLNSSSNSNAYWVRTSDSNTLGGMPAPVPTAAPAPAQVAGTGFAAESADKGYSTTNIQVAGVDEADTVKTDGKYLYVIGNNSQVVYILDANPQNARVVAKLALTPNSYISGIYLSTDGNKLAVLGSKYVYYDYYGKAEGRYTTDIAMPNWGSSTNFVYVYDVSNKASPTLARNFTMSGNYVNSRMIGNYVYDIVTENAYLYNGVAVLPTVFSGSKAITIDPVDIYYTNSSDTYYSYTSVVAVNIMDSAAPITNMTIMMGGAGEIYVSQSNIYVTFPVYKYEYEPIKTTAPTPSATSAPSSTGNGTVTILPAPMPMPIIRSSTTLTAIYRIHVVGDSMVFAAQGNVTGTVLNQYSMDEYNGYFRIATTSYNYDSNTGRGTQQNNLYVLNSALVTVGKIENIASGENLHAARFMGNRAYLVTFMKTDPLFVIDLSTPSNPKILGELIMPGYSDYLHPYDETHLIGIGKEAVEASQGDFAWYQGLKLSLFDVSDVNDPREVAKFNIGDRGTNSEVLYNPKALLFDYSRNLLVLPVDLYLINETATPTPFDRWGPSDPESRYGQFVWQGVYVFNVDLTNGYTLKGNITQFDNPTALLNNPSLLMRSDHQWMEYSHFITRSLYIDNNLYTISQSRVQINSLDSFAQLARIELR